MVYMLKFDIAHSHAIYHKKEMNVRESPTGQVEKLSYLFDLDRKNYTNPYLK